MKFLNYINTLQKNGDLSFTVEKAMNDLGLSKNTILAGIHRLKIHEYIVSPSQGFYVIVPPEYQKFGCIPEQELTPLLMKHINCDYYVSLLSGGLFHGASHQKPNQFQIITNKIIREPVTLGRICLSFTYKKTLIGLPIESKSVRTGYLKVATPELVAFDLLKFPEKSGGLNHIATVLAELVESINENKLIELIEFVGEKAPFQRMGYILDKIETMDDVKKELISKRLHNYLLPKIRVFTPLAQELSRIGHSRSKKWKIIENTSIESDL